VIGASLYIILHSARNRIARRLRRLREPRYMIGMLAAGAYLFANILGSARAGRDSDPPEFPPDLLAVLPSLAGAGLLLLAGLAWFLPSSGGAIDFSEAEVQFLFTAPVSRRQLLVHRLLRSQIGLLFAALVPVFFFGYWNGSVSDRVSRWAALWVLFVTARIYFTGVALARGRLLAQSGSKTRRVRLTPMVIVLSALAIVAAAIARELLSRPVTGFGDAVARLRHAVDVGPVEIVLWPFTALIRPAFAGSLAQFGSSMAGALLVLAGALLWVLTSDDAFQEKAPRISTPRSGRMARSPSTLRVRAAGWALALSGRTEALFFWKNSMHTLRSTNLAKLLQYGTPAIVMGVAFGAMRMAEVEAQGLAAAFSTFAVVVTTFVVFFGPQIMMADLRADLRHLELLKTWPIEPTEVVRGELLWPGSLVTFFAWFALVCASAFSAAALPQWSIVWRLSVTGALILVVPALVFTQYVVHNAAVVLFPAWVPLDNDRPRGLDAMGQRLIFMAGVVVALAAAMAPGVMAGAMVWFVLYKVAGAATLVIAAAVCLAVVAAEMVLATKALGTAYNDIDLTEVERAE
jgi:ABC-2 type transport system permease protein